MPIVLAASHTELPDRIGKYPVEREIGRGPASRVFLSVDPFAGREVAVKLLDPRTPGDPEAQRRFRRALINEAALASRLSHPHIVSLYDAVAEDDACYVVMEHVAGQSLEPRCYADSLLPMGQVVEIAFKCALALEHAHQQGVIHRNLKPSNILLYRDTDIKVSDFCSGRAEYPGAGRLPAADALIYWSPEQVQELGLTPQTDLYALGMVMYRLLTGHQPFYGASAKELAKQIMTAAPVLPSHHRPDLPALLETVVMRAIDRDLRRRYPNWQEFSADLTDAYRTLNHAAADDSDTERFNVVRGLSFFREFQDAEIWQTLEISNLRHFPAQRVVVREGDRGECFYVLTSGEVQVTRSGAPLDILTPGDCFGEMLYFSQASARRTTTITSLTPITALEINSTALRLAPAQCQVQFNKAFMRILIDRLTWANAKLAAV